MKRDISLWQFGGFVFTAVLGTVLHFLYDWAGKSAFIAPFSAINESTWEHMKLLFFPMFIFALIQSRFFKSFDNFWCIKLLGIFIGLSLIPVLFYTLNGVFGKTPDWVNISIFFIAVAAAFLLETRLLRQDNFGCSFPLFAFITICFIGVLFVIFTFYPPEIPLFQDPLAR